MFTIKQFNDHVKNNLTLFEKALTTASGSGGALISESLEREVTNILMRLSPEISLLYLKKIQSNQHKYNRYTALPGIGGAMGESGSTPVGQSTYVRKTLDLKEIRRKGRVTDFLADASEEVIDAVAIEMQNNLLAHVHDIINYSIWGNEYANTYEFSGLDFYIGELTTTNHYNRKIKAQYGETPVSIKDLDDMIDYSNRRGGNKHARAFLMSPELASLYSRLITNIRDNRTITDKMSQIDINGGWRLWAYRDIPIVETSSTTPMRQLGTVTPTVSGSGSGLGGAATIYIRVAEVTKNGEELASAEVTQALSTADTMTLTWAAPTDSDVYRYKIYMGTATNPTLKKIIPGKIYVSGAVSTDVTTVTFSTNPNTVDPTVSAPASFAGIVTTVPVHMRDDIAYAQDTGHGVPETIFLWDLDPIQGMGKVPYTNKGGSEFGGLVTSEAMAKTDAWREFLFRSTMGLTPSFEGTSYCIRGMRTF
jgi:hypothetical protein